MYNYPMDDMNTGSMDMDTPETHKEGSCDCNEVCTCGDDCACKTGECMCQDGTESCCKDGACVCHVAM
jgi:hypothetical protein